MLYIQADMLISQILLRQFNYEKDINGASTV